MTQKMGFFISRLTIDAHGTELWKTDGSADGTTRLTDLNAGEETSVAPWLRRIVHVGQRLFFRANDGIHGEELWYLPIQPQLPELPESVFLPYLSN